MPVEVACPGCGSQLKAPDTMVGKKAKCKKCATSFRIPGPAAQVDSVGESQMLSAIGSPGVPAPAEDDAVPMATPIEDSEAPLLDPTLTPPAKNSPKAPAVARLEPAKPAFHSGKSIPSRPAIATPTPKSTPARQALTPPPQKPVPPPAQEPKILSLDDAEEIASAPQPPISAKPSTPDHPFAGNPFAFDSSSAQAPESAPSGPSKQIKETVKPTKLPTTREADPFATPFAHAPETVALDEPFTFQEPQSLPVKEKTKKAERFERSADKPKKPPSKPQADSSEDPETLQQIDSGGASSSADPFSFSADASAVPERENPRSRAQKRTKDGEELDEQDSRRHPLPVKKSNTLLLLVGAIAMMALGGGITALVVFMKKDPEVAKKSTEKKEEPAPAPAAVEAVPKDDAKAAKKDSPTKDRKKDSQRKEQTPARTPKASTDPQAAGVPMLALPDKLKSYTFRAPSTKPESLQTPSQGTIQAQVAFDSVKRFFPSSDRTNHDVVVVWQSAAGFNGAGERFSVDSYSAMTGIMLGRFDFEGDGKNLKCDLSADSKILAVAVNGKVNLWELASKSRILPDFDPYLDKPAHNKAGLAAVFMAKNSNNFATVTTAGVIHLFETATQKLLAEYTPENAVAGRIILGKNVAVDETHDTLVVAAGGAIHQVKLLDLTRSWKLDLGGDVGRPFGIAVQGMPGRISYTFETDAEGKKERAILFCLPNGNPTLFRWQDSAGEPISINWSGDFIVVGTAEGVVWFEYNTETKIFSPLAMGKTPSGKGLHSATERAHWYLLPSPGNPTQSLILELATPIQDSTEFGKLAAANKPLDTLRLNDKGLWK